MRMACRDLFGATGKTATESSVMDVFYMNHMDVLPIRATVIQTECKKESVLSNTSWVATSQPSLSEAILLQNGMS